MAGENTWTYADLAEYADVRSRYTRAGDLTGESTTSAQNTQITTFITKAKTHIGRRLDSELRKMHSDRVYDSSQNLKDLISNPSVLKEAAVAWTLKLLCEDAAGVIDTDYNHQKMLDFHREFEEEFRIALSLIEFDKDASGAIEQDEREQGLTSTTFFRV